MNQDPKKETQISQTNQLSKEELTKTQVLNLNDLEKVAKYEKKVSKKPAIILAILGILLIVAGFTLQYTVFAEAEPKDNKTDKKENATKESSIVCNFTQPANADGTDLVLNMTLNFNQDKLKSYSKILSIAPTVGQEAVGTASITNALPAYQALMTTQISGYQLTVSMQGTSLQGNLMIDLPSLNKTQLTEGHKANIFTNVEFDLDETKEAVLTKTTTAGYTCN